MTLYLLVTTLPPNVLGDIYVIAEKLSTALLGAVITLAGLWIKNRGGVKKVELHHELAKVNAENEEALRIRNELRGDLDALRQSFQAMQTELDTERRIKLHLLEQIMFLQARSKIIQTNSENVLAWLRAKAVDVPDSLYLSVPELPPLNTP